MEKGMMAPRSSTGDMTPNTTIDLKFPSMMGTISSITRWHAKCRPTPSQVDASATLGCHFEEITEMADTMLLVPGLTESFEAELIEFINRGKSIADTLKANSSGIDFFSIPDDVRLDLIDSYMDQLVTVLGTAYTQHYDVFEAAHEVDSSNWSKFDRDGNPIFNENKKVMKGPNYHKAVLDSFILDVVMSFPQEEEKTTTTASMEKIMSELIQVSTEASYDELREAQERLNATIEAKRADARNAGVQKIIDLVNEFGFTAEELNKALTGKVKSKGGKAKSTSTPAAPKYRDPATGATWTGRGVAPAWIKDYAKEDRGQFLIEQPALAPAPAPAATEAEPVPAEAAPAEATAPVFGNTVEA